jgi:ATP-binding cassette subfamily F protein uup
MDRLVDHLFVFEGGGAFRDFPGNYSLYRMTLESDIQSAKGEEREKKKSFESSRQIASNGNKNKFSFKEKREFDQLEKEIADLNKEKKTITNKLNSENISFDDLNQFSVRIGIISDLLDEKELRWLELSEKIE